MIIFYDKTTGKIIGTIQGRVHTKEHLNMWIVYHHIQIDL